MSAASTASAAPAPSQIDGAPARACLTLAVQADGATIRTVEGLAPEPGRLSVLQDAFRRHHALQCGFCTAGILMSLDWLSARQCPIAERGRAARISRRATSAAAPAMRRSSPRRSTPRRSCGSSRCLISAPASSPASRATRTRSRSSMATCGSPTREWYRRISALVAGFDELGLKPGDHLVTRAAEPLGGRDPALGLPVRRHRRSRRSTGAPQPTRSITAARTREAKARGLRGRVGATPCAARQGGARHAAHRRSALPRRAAVRHAGHAVPAADADAARRRRRLVADALHVRHHGASRRACRAATAPSAPPRSPMWRRTSTATANARSA